MAALNVLPHTSQEWIASVGGGGGSNLRALLCAVHSSTFLFQMMPAVPVTIFLQIVRSSAFLPQLSNSFVWWRYLLKVPLYRSFGAPTFRVPSLVLHRSSDVVNQELPVNTRMTRTQAEQHQWRHERAVKS